MSAVEIDQQQARQTSEAAPALDDRVRLRLAGAFTAANAAPVRTRLRRVLQKGHTRVLVDLQAVTRIDAVGIAILLEARRAFQAQAGGTLVLRANGIVCRAL